MSLGNLLVGTSTLLDLGNGIYKQSGLADKAENTAKVTQSPSYPITLVDGTLATVSSHAITFKNVETSGQFSHMSLQLRRSSGISSASYKTFVDQRTAAIITATILDLLKIGAV